MWRVARTLKYVPTIVVREACYFLIGRKTFEVIVKMCEVEPRKEARKPKKVISASLGLCDTAVNALLFPFGMRKKRSWSTAYISWTENRGGGEQAC